MVLFVMKNKTIILQTIFQKISQRQLRYIFPGDSWKHFQYISHFLCLKYFVVYLSAPLGT